MSNKPLSMMDHTNTAEGMHYLRQPRGPGTGWVFRAQNRASQPLLILACGLVIDARILLVIVMLVRANQNAPSSAEQLTRTLRARTVRLEKGNHPVATACRISL
ncbi:hypothetical protein [Mesobacterium pallidum]|uniref:hypothetical protein n=1 Tax=Mesobacterium pallidum TaxID=2872037 RepID=UPI001EE35EBE|nr:hypothetical protein [Mesobacterium pallidum]